MKVIWKKKIGGPDDFSGVNFAVEQYGFGIEATVKMSNGDESIQFGNWDNSEGMAKFWEQVGENAMKFATTLRQAEAEYQKQKKQATKQESRKAK
jgi:hypothetical protein